MKRISRSILSFLLCAVGAVAFTQQPPKPADPKPAGVVAKASPASDALNAAAKGVATEQAAYDTALQNAKSTLNSSSKDLQKQLADLNKSLETQLRADKKYKPLLDQIDTLTKQLQGVSSEARTKFSQRVQPIERELNTDTALVSGLIPVVRKENGWPDSATYDSVTQTWNLTPADPAKK